ncbi:hypothetical protein CPB86DRAFT_798939 [Serendipita vermifera]|nr:hypothetical protein CPB86DRAFT_798939 [Serendipita vermifera]
MYLGEDIRLLDLSSTKQHLDRDLETWNPHPRHVPTELEVQSTQALIQRDEELLRDLRLQLARLESLTAELNEQVERVQRTRLNKVAFISPCRRIPFEILGEIFALAIDNDLQSLHVVKSVCRRWRDVVSHTSKLWNHLRISLMDHTQRFKWSKRSTGRWQRANTAIRLRDCLERAGDTDELHIHLSVLNAPREVAKDDEEMMDLLRKTLPRWNTVTLHLNRRENVLEGFDQWTSLRSLSVTFLRQVSTTSFEPLFDSIDRSALQLKTLHISGDTREWAPYFQSVFPRLVSFTLQDSSLRCLGNIHWDNLQHLVLVHCAGALATMTPSPFDSGTTSFPAIKTLTIHRAPAEVIQGFPLDTLKELSISDSEMTLTEVRVLPKLESLDLQLKASQMGFLTWLKTPNIKSFELKQVEPGDLNGNTPLAALTTFLNQNARMVPEQPPVNAQDEEESTDPSTSTAVDATTSPDASSSTIATTPEAPTALTTELERTSAFSFRHVAIQDVVVDPSAFESVLKRSPNLEVLRIVPISLTAARKLLWLKEKQGTLAGDGPPDIVAIEPQANSTSAQPDNGPSDEVMGGAMDSIPIDTDTEMQIIEQEASSDADRTSVELDLLGLDWCMPDTTTTTAASSQSGQIYSPTDFMDLPMDEGPSSIPTPELYVFDDLPSSSDNATSSMTLASTSTSAPLSKTDLSSPPSTSPSAPKSMDDVPRASSAHPPYHAHTTSVDPIPSSSMEISNSLPIELIPSSALSDSDMPAASTSVSTPTPITAATTPAAPTTLVASSSPSPETTDKVPPPTQLSSASSSSSQESSGGQYVAPALREIKIRILPYALYVEEDAEATLRKELEEVAKERTENGLPLSVKIFRNIVK